MNTKLLPFLALAALPLAGVRAQSPSSDAPAAPATAAPASSDASQIVYLPRLPGVNELTNAAAAHGFAIERIEQSSTQMKATYRNSAGQKKVVSYQLLPAAGATATVETPSATPVVVMPNQSAPAVAGQAPVVIMPSTPTVVVERPRTIYYEDADYYYSPRYYGGYWYPPVSLSLGFGYGWGRGGYHGGFHGGHR